MRFFFPSPIELLKRELREGNLFQLPLATSLDTICGLIISI